MKFIRKVFNTVVLIVVVIVVVSVVVSAFCIGLYQFADRQGSESEAECRVIPIP